MPDVRRRGPAGCRSIRPPSSSSWATWSAAHRPLSPHKGGHAPRALWAAVEHRATRTQLLTCSPLLVHDWGGRVTGRGPRLDISSRRWPRSIQWTSGAGLLVACRVGALIRIFSHSSSRVQLPLKSGRGRPPWAPEPRDLRARGIEEPGPLPHLGVARVHPTKEASSAHLALAAFALHAHHVDLALDPVVDSPALNFQPWPAASSAASRRDAIDEWANIVPTSSSRTDADGVSLQAALVDSGVPSPKNSISVPNSMHLMRVRGWRFS